MRKSQFSLHVQRNDTCPRVIPRNCACVKQVLIGWKLIFGYKVQWQQIHHTMEQFSTNQNPGYRMSPSIWLVENHSSVQCICYRWTFYPKIKLQPIRTCLMHAQICGMTVGHVSFHWTCITLHSVKMGQEKHFPQMPKNFWEGWFKAGR